MKSLSIIIPHFNSSKLLKRLLYTIPDIPEIEVLVVDDNSSEKELKNLRTIEKEICRSNVLFYENFPETKGAGNARNIGLKYAQGKWLLFADADDFFVDDMWETVRANLDENVDIIYFAPTSINLESGELADRHIHYMNLVERYSEDDCHENEIQLRYKYWGPCSKMIRRELVERKGIRFEGTLYANDMMFSTWVGHYAIKIKAVPKTIYCITKSKDSITMHTDKYALEIRRKVFSRYYFFLHKVLKKRDIRELGFSSKDFFYFCFCELGWWFKESIYFKR